jgi:hypothetical protein
MAHHAQYNPRPIAANGTLVLVADAANGSQDTQCHGFLCTTAGSIRVHQAADGSGAAIVPIVAVTAGMYLPMPMTLSVPSAVVLSGGCTGTFFAI